MVDPVSSGRNIPTGGPTAVSDASRPRTASLASVRVPRAATLSGLVQLAQAIAESGPPLDYAKIATLREAVASGAYKIDAQSIADAMTAFHSARAA